MSSSYKLLYQDRRQFIFEEAEETHTTAILTLVAGFIAGSLLGVYFASLDATTAGSILLAIVTYITILTSTFSLKTNPVSVLLMFITSFGAVIALIYVSRIVLGYFSDSLFKLMLVFAGLFALLAELLYLWSRVTWVEDTRMHQLVEVDGVGNVTHHNSHYRESNIGSFFRWIIEIIWFGILRMYFSVRGEAAKAQRYPILFLESMSKWPDACEAPPISIRNDTLKRVKICVYHKADYCCWVPVGGLTGGMYGLDRGEELVVSPHWPTSAFRVKAFAHGVIDYELACHPCVVRGRKYAFIDVGKPITALPNVSPPGSSRKAISRPESSVPSSSSDEEDGAFVHLEPPVRKSDSRVGGLRRVPSSRANLSSAGGSHPPTPSDHGQLMTPTTSRRKAYKQFVHASDLSDCVAVLNESTSEVRITFYNIEDTSFVISVDSFAASHASSPPLESNLIPRGEWKVFEYSGPRARDKFCLRVKSAAGQASMELSYCTAMLGDALVVRDPIVSGGM